MGHTGVFGQGPLFSRRAALKGLATAGAVLAGFVGGLPLVRSARAQGLEDRSFIFCYFHGGWDLLLCLDPRDPALFRNDLIKTTRIQPGYDLLPSDYGDQMVTTSVPGMNFGPCVGRLSSYADRLCVVRGMSMDTLTHEVGRRRYLTGHPPNGLQAAGSSFSTLLASQLGADQPVPQLSVRVESYNRGLPSFASAIRVGSVDDLVRALSHSPHSLSDGEVAALDALFEELGACNRTRQSEMHREGLIYRDASKLLVQQGLSSLFDFGADTPEMEALRQLYGIDPDDLNSAAAQCAAAVTAITSGISRCVNVMPATDLDQHGPDWASYHSSRLVGGFNLVCAMIDDLASREYKGTGESWLDHTTLVCFSEFGRSTLLNSSQGRDHFLHNACLLAGAGVKKGAVIGRSSDTGMNPMPVDLATGSPQEGGVTIYPEHIFRALLESVGISEDLGDFKVDPLRAILT